jgi:hypothetical protein
LRSTWASVSPRAAPVDAAGNMRRRIPLILVIGCVAWAGVASARASASSFSGVYVACDEPRSRDYPKLAHAPNRCDLGLSESTYETQRVPGHPQPEALYLRALRWTRWGHHIATARGREACTKLDGGPPDGVTHCIDVTVTASNPQHILPAGGADIYQLIRVVVHMPVHKVVKTLYCDEHNECSAQPAPRGFDAELGCTWELAPYSESLGDAEDNCVAATATLPVEYYRPGTDY